MRLKWILTDSENSSNKLFVSFQKQFKDLNKNSKKEQKAGSTEKSEEFFTPPEIVLSSTVPRHKKSISPELNNIQISFPGRLRTCKNDDDYRTLADSLWNEFYDCIQKRNGKETYQFIVDSSPIYLPLIRKTGSPDFIIAMLDTLPFFLFFGHRAPYDKSYIDCGKLLMREIRKIIKHPDLSFRGKDCEPFDDILHYLFHNLYLFLSRGRLLAFQNLFIITLDLLDNSEKFHTKYLYVPLITEIYYWLPFAYRYKLRSFILGEVRSRIAENPDSPLKPLLFLVKDQGAESFNRNIVVYEFLKEAYKNGNISPNERKVIKSLVSAINFNMREYRTVLREVLREIKLEQISEHEELNGEKLMKKLIRLALVNNEIGPNQKELLSKIALVLSVEKKAFQSYLAEIRREESKQQETGFRRLGWKGVSQALIEHLNWFKWNQLKLEDYARSFLELLRDNPYDPQSNQFVLDGEMTDNFAPLEGEIRIASFSPPDKPDAEEEIGVLVFSPRNQLVKWFEIAGEIEYLIFDNTNTTFSLEIHLLNFHGKIMMTRGLPISDPESLRKLLKSNQGRYRLFIVDEESNALVYWQKTASYFIEKKKISPLLEALEAKKFTSIKVISQIGKKKDPDEIIYYHAMVQNVLFLGNRQDEYTEMIELCHKVIEEKFPDDFKLCYYLGYLYFEVGKKEEAYHWLLKSIKHHPYFKDALILYCEKKLAENVLDKLALGFLKFLDLFFPREERIGRLYELIERKYALKLRPLIAKSKLTTVTFMLEK
jgi:hypothetical protein